MWSSITDPFISINTTSLYHKVHEAEAEWRKENTALSRCCFTGKPTDIKTWRKRVSLIDAVNFATMEFKEALEAHVVHAGGAALGVMMTKMEKWHEDFV
jgi:hypothetical protein